MGFEPMRISPLGPEPSPLTAWVTLLPPVLCGNLAINFLNFFLIFVIQKYLNRSKVGGNGLTRIRTEVSGFRVLSRNQLDHKTEPLSRLK